MLKLQWIGIVVRKSNNSKAVFYMLYMIVLCVYPELFTIVMLGMLIDFLMTWIPRSGKYPPPDFLYGGVYIFDHKEHSETEYSKE